MQGTDSMNKSVATNFLAVVVVLAGYLILDSTQILFMTGLFALSGSVTNWLAIHMLFEKVPLLYGSGIIPNKFEEFKMGIKSLVMEEFFNQENITLFFKTNRGKVEGVYLFKN